MFFFNPLEQFEVIVFFMNNFLYWTNFMEVLLSAQFFILLLLLLIIYDYQINVKFYLQVFFEKILFFLEDIVHTNASKYNQNYLPFVFILFIPLLFSNLGGMFPYNFTITSHLFVTFFFSFTCFFGLNWVGIVRHKKRFLNLFLPDQIPLLLIPLLVFIEIFSYIARLISLGVRLFANMMSGHTLLKILSGFLFSIFSAGGIFIFLNLIPVSIFLIIVIMELGIALLQVYVFLVLYCIYLKDIYIIGH